MAIIFRPAWTALANTLFEGMVGPSGMKVEGCYLKKELESMRILSSSGQGVTIPAKGYSIDRSMSITRPRTVLDLACEFDARLNQDCG